MTKLKIKDGEMTTINYLENWHTIKLGDIVKEIIDNRGKTPPITSNGYELLEVNSIKSGYRHPDYSKVEKFINETTYRNWFRSGHILKDDLIIPTVGTIGGLAISPENRGSIAQNLIALRLKREVNPLFIYYLLSSLDYREKILNLDIGGVQPSIKVPHLVNLDITIPKPLTQAKVVGILSSLDDKIEMNRKINKNLEKLAGTIFKKWFVNIGDNLPEGWRIGKIHDLIRIESGFPFNSTMFDCDGDYKLVTIKNVQDGFFVPECTNSLSRIPLKMPPHCKLRSGDILLSLTGNVGRVCQIYSENYLLNQRVANLVPINENNRAFTYFLFRQKDFQNTLMNISHGTAQQNLSPIETKSLDILIPSQEILDRFADAANPIFQKLVENNKEIGALSTTRDALLPGLMSGKIRVKI